MSRWDDREDVVRGADYNARWKALAAAGASIHGEVDLVESVLKQHDLVSPRLLDAGCGTGRVAIELAARGYTVAGVDLDETMLAEARTKMPNLNWHLGDLLDIALDQSFDVIVMAGNVMIFVEPGTEGEVVANMASHLVPGGLVIAGFQTGGGRLAVDDYDAHCDAASLDLVHRWSTWEREPFAGNDYAVSVHQSR